MANYCTSCASPIPDGQGKSCSMCYGDVDHGSDGYYRRWLENECRQEEDERQYWERVAEQEQKDEG